MRLRPLQWRDVVMQMAAAGVVMLLSAGLAAQTATYKVAEPAGPALLPTASDSAIRRQLVQSRSTPPGESPPLRWLIHPHTKIEWPRLAAGGSPAAIARINAALEKLQLRSVREALDVIRRDPEDGKVLEGVDVHPAEGRLLTVKRSGGQEVHEVERPLEARANTFDLVSGAAVDLYAKYGLRKPGPAGVARFSNAAFGELFFDHLKQGKTAADLEFFRRCFETGAPRFDYLMIPKIDGLHVEIFFLERSSRTCSTVTRIPYDALQRLPGASDHR